jgi:adenylate cyclase
LPAQHEASAQGEERWRKLLTEGHQKLHIAHLLFRYLPSAPRCKVCHNPFGGLGGKLVGLFGFRRSRKNPNLCTQCCDTLPPGGAELDVAVLFADVRGSTAMGERMEPGAYAAAMNRFYNVATEVLVREDAIIDKLIGDEVMALFIPGICGPEYHRRAAEAALSLLRAVGNRRSKGPWMPIGVGVNSGLTYVGNVGGDGVVDFTALGDTVNIAARLASSAAAGEALLSEPIYNAVAAKLPELERRTLSIRGREAPLPVHVLRAAIPT